MKGLYFPLINVPEEPWLIHALLYMDEVHTIAPGEVLRDRSENLTPWMQELADEGLIGFQRPEQYSGNEQAFLNGFLTYLYASGAMQDDRRSHSRATSRIHLHKDAARGPHIHRGKDRAGIFRYLEDVGLAVPSENPGWIRIEKGVANLYMAFLAAFISEKNGDLRLISDRPEPLMLVTNRVQRDDHGNFQPQHEQARDLVLRDMFPSIRGPVSATELRRFKERNQDVLWRFRDYIERRVSEIAVHGGMKRDLEDLRDELRRERQELKNDLRITFRERAVKCGLGIVAATASVPGIVQGLDQPITSAVVLSAVGCVAGIGVATAELSSRRSRMGNAKLAYAILAEDQWD